MIRTHVTSVGELCIFGLCCSPQLRGSWRSPCLPSPVFSLAYLRLAVHTPPSVVDVTSIPPNHQSRRWSQQRASPTPQIAAPRTRRPKPLLQRPRKPPAHLLLPLMLRNLMLGRRRNMDTSPPQVAKRSGMAVLCRPLPPHLNPHLQQPQHICRDIKHQMHTIII